MKNLFKNVYLLNPNEKVLTQEELDERFDNAYEDGKSEQAYEVEELEEKVESQKAQIKELNRKLKRQATEIEALEEDRDEVAEVVKQKLENDNTVVILEAKKEALDRLDKELKDRESKVGKKEDGEYKKGYADGVADGVRKINEITAVDRENAMKVAMVAAASHSSPDVIKELNSNVKGLTAGTTDQEG